MTDGVILYDKPRDITSHDVVYRVRRQLPRKTRVGHAGTLDPFATGLLLVLVGRGTRAQRFLMGLGKTYETIARFGAVSTTGDSDGEITETGVVPDGDLTLPTGVVRQRPPAYSALRVDGERAYARARRGETVELPEREVTVELFRQRWHDGARRAFEIRCSSGTYVRSLIADLGDAYCEELRRTAIGHFDVADADPERIVGLNDALAFLPEHRLEGDEARRAGYGVAVAHPDPPAQGPGYTRLTDADGLIAIAEPRIADDGAPLLKPIVGLRG
ncbi:tRNA pseudouridine(55) synthase TruB [Conexibacter sp. CPCC 206217]|uniref:tRNA pseudouridine(55) synthase TruB n=1 Tax=Conexibacter sp. CPCC 206217 TaxID=3064574 RepID=UPI0027268279|nr:tRNA pseudouridine(55) synthase TruB [Conexibacter sp. CPCC 206217]MDO8210695.1 tRNA pseudouridine(55) synthase TruB [Conexibacter sp. CPCC 206217]